MKLSFSSTLCSLVLLTGIAAVGCSAQTSDSGDGVSVDEANAAKVAAGTFKLYDEPHASPNLSCDVYTSLALSADSASKAQVEERLGGMCELYVAPNPRGYQLQLTSTACGSKIFSGSTTNDNGSYSIKITDNRGRLCEDVIPALIVVEETFNGHTSTKYSYDAAPPAQDITAEGTLASVMAIGGETTGFALMSNDGSHELVLDPGEVNQFVDGKKARVKGKLTTLTGVETGIRQALDVTEMLVCPNAGWINCMPGPGVRLSNLCASSNRDWIRANCDGVDFAF